MTDFRFDIEQHTESSWTFVFRSDADEIKIWASEFMDPLGSLLSQLRMILKKGTSEARVSMIHEPQENIWRLRYSEEFIHIDIWSFANYSGVGRDLKTGQKRFSGSMYFDRFLNQLVNALRPYEHQQKVAQFLNELIELRRKND